MFHLAYDDMNVLIAVVSVFSVRDNVQDCCMCLLLRDVCRVKQYLGYVEDSSVKMVVLDISQ